MNVGDRRTQNI